MRWLKNRFEKEGAGLPAPETGWARVGVMALTHFWKLVAANLLFVVFSLPVITLPAALTALNRVCVIIYKDGNIFLWYEFWREFKRSLLRQLPPFLGFSLLLFGGYFFMSLGNGNAQLGFIDDPTTPTMDAEEIKKKLGLRPAQVKAWLDTVQEGYLLDAICDVAATMDLPASKLQLLQDRLPEREFLKAE